MTSLQGASGELALWQPEPAPLAAADSLWLDVLPPQAEVLRGYQRALMGEMASALERSRRILVQAPTGAGKTHLIATLVAAATIASLRVLILATRTRLVRQLHERLDAFGVRHGVLAAALPGLRAWSAPVQVASVDTLYRRCIADRKMPLPGAEVVVFDEAHLALGVSRQKLLDSYPQAQIFGFTATPAKTSGAALGEQFDVLVHGPSVTELIAEKQLVAPRIFAKPIMSVRELKAVAKDAKTGDYATGALSELMRRPKLVGDVVTNWLRIANGKRTLVFACDKAHGAQLLAEFRQAGVAAEQLTDDDDDDTREQAIARLEAGVTLVLVNCFLLSYGIDIPAVEAVVLARPTRSVVLFLQAIGRGMRPSAGKDFVLLIDHGRVVESLGLPTYERDWSLHGENVNQRARQLTDSRRIGADNPRTCPECARVWVVQDEGTHCPECGWQPVARAKPVLVTQADLGEIAAAIESPATVATFFAEACAWYAQRWPDRWAQKEKSGRWWAWSATKRKFKRPEDERMPRGFWEVPTQEISPETAGFLKSELIRWARSRKAV